MNMIVDGIQPEILQISANIIVHYQAERCFKGL